MEFKQHPSKLPIGQNGRSQENLENVKLYKYVNITYQKFLEGATKEALIGKVTAISVYIKKEESSQITF